MYTRFSTRRTSLFGSPATLLCRYILHPICSYICTTARELTEHTGFEGCVCQLWGECGTIYNPVKPSESSAGPLKLCTSVCLCAGFHTQLANSITELLIEIRLIFNVQKVYLMYMPANPPCPYFEVFVALYVLLLFKGNKHVAALKLNSLQLYLPSF